MIRESTIVGPFQCNCTILACEETQEAIIVDPGDEAEKIIDIVNDLGVKLVALIHTHAHLDHIGATGKIMQTFHAPILLHQDDLPLYDNLQTQAAMFHLNTDDPEPVDRYLEHGEVIPFGTHSVHVIHTPGHTPGSVCFKVDDHEEMLFSGDTLFKRSVGRTDLWGGSHPTLISSIQDHLLSLDDDVHVFPGHGPDTYIGEERKMNSFLQ